jgi:hypothetical protein
MDKNLQSIDYDLYIFDEERIVDTINNILLCKNYSYIDYGDDYDYDFFYKNISINIRYRYNGSNNGIWWRGDNAQNIRLQYDETKINKEDLEFVINAFNFLLEKKEKHEFTIVPENIDEIIQDMGVKNLIKGIFSDYEIETDSFYNYQYRFEYNNIEVAIRVTDNDDKYYLDEYESWEDFSKNNIYSNKKFIILRYAENEDKIDKNDIEIIKNKVIK